jgi:hypothetical protein
MDRRNNKEEDVFSYGVHYETGYHSEYFFNIILSNKVKT